MGRAIVALRREREASSNVGVSATPAAAAPTSAVTAPAPANGSNSAAADGSAAPFTVETEVHVNEEAVAAKEAELLLLAGKPCPTGTYELLSVVTHQGRYADSGHYVGWARAGGADAPQQPSTAESQEKKKEEEQETTSGPAAKRQKNVVKWRKFDDDKVTEVPWESIDLAGGRSDYHVAYLLLMKHLLVVPSEEELKVLARQM